MTIQRSQVLRDITEWADQNSHEFENLEKLSLSLLILNLIERSYGEGFEDGQIERNEP